MTGGAPSGGRAVAKVTKIGGGGAVLLTVILFVPQIVQKAAGPDSYEYQSTWSPSPSAVKDNVAITLTMTRIGFYQARLWASAYKSAPQPVPKTATVVFSFGDEAKADFATSPPTKMDAAGKAVVTIFGTDYSDRTTLHAVVSMPGGTGLDVVPTVNDPAFTTQPKQ